MKKTTVQLPTIKLVGIKARTNNHTEWNGKETDRKILPCVQRYFHQQLAEKIPNRKKPGTTFCIYTEYESDHTGDYTYFIGEEVTDFSGDLGELTSHSIPTQTYKKFTTEPGEMPHVIRDAWLKIWQMDAAELGKRRYLSDFEIYDERAADHQNIVLDIYIGVEG